MLANITWLNNEKIMWSKHSNVQSQSSAKEAAAKMHPPVTTHSTMWLWPRPTRQKYSK